MSIANILKKNNYSIYCNDIDIDDQLIFKGFGLLQPIFTVPETSFISFTLINI